MIMNLAFQNLRRNGKRTFSTMLIVTFGVAVIVLLGALLKGMSKNWARLQIESTTGAIQIEHVDYRNKGILEPLTTTIVNSSYLIREIEDVPGVVAAYGKLRISGVISTGAKSTVFDGNGVDTINLGRTLPISDDLVISGRPLGQDNTDVVLGEYLAQELGLRIGDPVILAVRTNNGVLDLMYGKLVGVKNGPHFPAASYVEISLKQAQKLLRMEDRVSQISVRIVDQTLVDEISSEIEKRIGKTDTPTIIRKFPELIANYSTVTTSMNTVSYILGVIVVIIAGGGVANTMYMTVRERRKEIGTIMAIGMRSSVIRALFILEGAYLGMIGALAGALIATAIVFLIQGIGGIPIQKGITLIPLMDLHNMATAIVMTFIVSAAATWFPAALSTKLNPVECLYEH